MDQVITREATRQQPYNPKYDPLVSKGPGHNQAYAPTYWIGTAGRTPEDDGPVLQDMDVDVVVIGSGYTGLSCALHLAKEHGIKAHVLEANQVAWGCSVRNGGQAQISSGRLKRSQWIRRWGLDTAREMHAEVVEAFDLFRNLIKDHNIACDPQDGGHYYIAHRAWMMPSLEKETTVLNEQFGYRAKMVDKHTFQTEIANDREAHGAMWEPDGVGIHAAKLAFGLLDAARSLGAKVHTSSPVTNWRTENGVHYLETPGGTVKARKVCVATAAYVPRGLHKKTKDRLMPILSNSMVTRELTADELAECNINVKSPLTDTRTLRHYYRLLPDNRMQIGSRSSISGADADNPQHLQLLRDGLTRKFPALANIELDYSWWGWVDVSHDMMPRITQPDPAEQMFYAMGYGGNGVMYAAQAGKRMAELAAGKQCGRDLPIFKSELPHEGILTPFRRLGQWWLYHWYHYRDER
ncbi:FAD-binding oxidoreductase [Rhodobacteraceae bacterium RKSG542]|uniref:NAD(P)/FAD-dependent oxidoreductase n=1 Tax=Pseudovibrio flavus TaxID=2529854 RepID=UPI0012BCA3D8|nr:FAD-binding oxidoreductase [Pseudovibrio flavus]MTI18091.1 FAD-binding oxidoreductase [Pseudovibrio flavus]